MPAIIQKPKPRPIYTAVGIAIMITIGVMAYANTFQSPFLFDDNDFIVNDYAIRMTELTWDNVKTAALEGIPAHRYLPNISWALNYYFGQLNPFGYHLVNLCIHLLTGLFLFFLVKNTLHVYPGKMRDIHPEIPAFFAALIWIVQPVGTQAVTYICQRMASMVALFYVLSLLFYVLARMSMRCAPSHRLKPCLYFFLCALSAACAIATKENAGTLPLAIIIYEWFFFQELKSFRSRRQILWIGLFSMLFICIVFWYMGENPMNRILNSYSRRDFTLIERVMTEWRIMVYYISLFLWAPPGRLNLDHDYPLSLSPFNPPTTMIAFTALISLLALAVYMAKKDRLIAFCILWFFLTQATESTIIGIELIFEHRTYIPFMMTSLMFVLIIFRVTGKRPCAYGILIALALVFSIWTFQRNHIWQDPVTFWSDILTKSKNKTRAYENLAFVYQQKDDWAKAVLYYKKAISIADTTKTANFSTYANLGAALLKQNRFYDAVYYYSTALELKHATANILQPLAFALANIGELDAAKNHYLLALTIHPEDEAIKRELDALSLFLSQFPDPNTQIRSLLFASPDNPALLLKQGDLYERQGQSEKAITVYQKADSLTYEEDEMLRRALLSRLAKLFAVTRQYESAIAVYRRLIRMAPDNALLYYNTAAVYAVSGDIPKAKAFLNKAMQKGLNVAEKIKSDPNFEKIRSGESDW